MIFIILEQTSLLNAALDSNGQKIFEISSDSNGRKIFENFSDSNVQKIFKICSVKYE